MQKLTNLHYTQRGVLQNECNTPCLVANFRKYICSEFRCCCRFPKPFPYMTGIITNMFQNLPCLPKRNMFFIIETGKNTSAERKEVFFGKHLGFPKKIKKGEIFYEEQPDQYSSGT